MVQVMLFFIRIFSDITSSNILGIGNVNKVYQVR